MRKVAAVCGIYAAGVLAIVAPKVAPALATGAGTWSCSGTYSARTVSSNVDVPAGGTCVLNASFVRGTVTVESGAYFEAGQTTITGDLVANQALTLYLHDRSTVGNIVAAKTAQVFIYDSSALNIGAGGAIATGYGHVHVCGDTVGGAIGVAGMGPDILVGDPAAGCGGNTVKTGDVWINGNDTYAELTIAGNTIQKGNLDVERNVGTSSKLIQNNTLPEGTLYCAGNQAPFTGALNSSQSTTGGQCS